MRRLYNNLLESLQKFWIPSWSCFLTLLIPFIIFGFITYEKFNSKCEFVLCGSYSDLIEITAGMGAVSIGLAFFVAQSLLDRDDPDKARVLLRTSNFFPLLMSQIFTFIILLIGNSNIFGDLNCFIYFLIGALGFFTISCLARTINILIRPYYFEKAWGEAFWDILRENLIKMLECEKQINEYLCKNKVERTLAALLDKNKYYLFEAINEGAIVKIKLNQLDKLNRLITSVSDISKNTNVVILKDLYSDISKDSFLLGIRRDIIDNNPKLRNKIKRLARNIFIIKKYNNMASSRFEISRLKEKCLNLIDHGKESNLKEIIKLYRKLIEILFEYGSKFSEEQLENSSQLKPKKYKISYGFILENINDIYIKAMESGNRGVIEVVSDLHVLLSISSIKNNNHLVCYYFICFPYFMYQSAYKQKKDNKELFDVMVNKSLRYLTELVDYYLIPPYENKELNADEFKKYASCLVEVFQDLLKQSFDNKDFSSFKIFLEKLLTLFNKLNRKRSSNKEDFTKLNGLQNFLKDLQQEKLFEIGSWIIYEYKENPDKEISSFIEKILDGLIKYLKVDINKAIDLFVYLEKNNFVLRSWELKKHDSGEAVTIVDTSNTVEKLGLFYVALSLRILKKPSSEISFPDSQESSYSINDLIKIIDTIGSEKDKWAGIIFDDDLDKRCEQLKDLLSTAKKRTKV